MDGSPGMALPFQWFKPTALCLVSIKENNIESGESNARDYF
ncbi:hypothetical protein [Desulfospira joergensenii]|nr:hypothetical protein [Desulfospira joergensenii]